MFKFIDAQRPEDRTYQIRPWGLGPAGPIAKPFVDPSAVWSYINYEYQLANLTGQHLGRRRLTSKAPLPVLYGTDSGIHVALGLADGLKAAGRRPELFAVDRHQGLPPQAILQAQEYGWIVFCDSVMNYGAVVSMILGRLPQGVGPNAFSVLTYTTMATAAPLPTEGIPQGLSRLEQTMHRLWHPHVFYVSYVGPSAHDLYDRADAIAYAAQFYPDLLRYVRAFQKPYQHFAGFLIP
ncbi:MAG TPA: hypothetical protein VLI05_03860 [Candidatus Saccharimonadia bacterium]|nr:hypothetical protein [Candidatus Saccharimonadia bacterium]